MPSLYVTSNATPTIPANNNTGLYNATGNAIPIGNDIDISGNILANGYISAGGNITTSGVFVGNGAGLTGVVAGTANTAVTVTGNAQANITSVGVLTALSVSGNIAGNYILGNGSQLTGMYGNANVATYLPTNTANISAGTISAIGNITGNYLIGNGSQLTGTYSNANVAAFLPTYSGDITAEDITASATIQAAVLQTSGVSGNIVGANYVQANYFVGDGSYLTNINAGNIVGSYGNANVANYLASGNLTSNVITTGNVSGGYFLGNGSQLTGLPATYGNANVANYLASGNLTSNVITTGNVSGSYILGNGSQLTGLPATYGNANVATYLASGNVTSNIITTGNVTGSYILGNGSQLTGMYGNAAVATFLGNLGNTEISTSGNVTTGNLHVTGNLFTDDISSANIIVYGDQVITGNLTVQGNTTTINSNVITTNDKIITVANNQSTGANVDGAGFEAGNPYLAAWLFSNAETAWRTNINIVPDAGSSLNLGSPGNRWTTVYGNTGNFTGNVTANYVLGNGSQLTGMYGNANVSTYLASGNVTGNIITTGNVSGNYFIGNGSQLTSVSTSFAGEMHVSKDGNDSTGTGTILRPYLTITHALTQVVGGRNTIVIHPGGYTENPTITSEATQLITYDATGASTLVYGTVTIANTIGRIAGLKMANLAITGNAQAYINSSTVDEQFTKSSSGYVEVDDCELQTTGNVLISGSGITTIIGNKIANLVVNDAGASVLVKGANDCLMPQVTAGSLNIVDSIIRASSNTANAVTASAGTVVTLMNNQIVTPAADNVARVSIAGYHSIISVVYDKANSTLSNSLNSVAYFQTANVDSLVSSGNITGAYILGNGSQLTGLPSGYSNADVATYLASGNLTSNIITTGNVSGNYFVGNGSLLTGIASSYGNADVANYLASGNVTSNVITTGNVTGGNVISSGAVSLAGNLLIQGQLRYIQADFSTVVANGGATYLQTSVANSSTTIRAVPNGTNQVASYVLFNNSNISANTLNSASLRCSNTSINVTSSAIGNVATQLPITMEIQGNTYVTVKPVTGEVNFGGNTILGNTAAAGGVGNIVIGRNIATDIPYAPITLSGLNQSNGRIIMGSGFNGNISPAFDLVNSGRASRFTITDSYNHGANDIGRGQTIQNYITLTANVSNTASRINGITSSLVVGGANTFATTGTTPHMISSAIFGPQLGGVGNLSALGNVVAAGMTAVGAFPTVNTGSNVGNLYSFVSAPSFNATSTANTMIGFESTVNAGAVAPTRFFSFHQASNVNTYGYTIPNTVRAASEYYFLRNDDAVAQCQIGSLRSYNEYRYPLATSGTVNIDKTNSQVQYLAPTGNVTIGSFLNFNSNLTDGTNTDEQADTVTIIVAQGATPYTVTMPTGNASIKYASGTSTVGSTANAVTMIAITATRIANSTVYLTTISPEFV